MTSPNQIEWNLRFNPEAIGSLEPVAMINYFREQNNQLKNTFEVVEESVQGQSQIFTPTVGNGSTNLSSGDFTEDVGMIVVQGSIAFVNMAIKFGSGHGVTGNMQIGGLPFTSHETANVTNNDKLDWNFSVMNLESGDLFAVIAILPPNSKTIEAVYKSDGTQASLTSTAYDMTLTGFYRIAKA